MPTTTIIVLTAVIAMFVIFAGAVAWGDYQTRNLPKPHAKPERQPLKRVA